MSPREFNMNLHHSPYLLISHNDLMWSSRGEDFTILQINSCKRKYLKCLKLEY